MRTRNIIEIIRKIIPWLLLGIIVLLPWQAQFIFQEGEIGGESWQYGTFSVFAIDILIVAVVLLLLFAQRNSGIKLQKYVWILLGAFFATAFFSIWFSTDREVSWFRLALLLEGYGVLWLFSSVKFSLRQLGYAFGLSGVIQSVFAISQFITQKVFASTLLGTAEHLPEVIGNSVIEAGGRFLRAYGTFQHPNLLAGFLVLCFIFVIGWYFISKKRIDSIFSLSAISIISVGLFFTFSRSAWGVMGASIFFLVFLALMTRGLVNRRKIISALIVIILISTIFSAMNFSIISTRLASNARLEVQSATERITGYEDSWTLLKDSWLHGVGIGAYTSSVREDVDTSREVWQLQPVHNIYLLIATELSIFGFIFFALFLIELIRKGVQKLSMLQSISFEWVVYLTAGLAVLLLGLFDHYFWSLHPGSLLMWLIFGLAIAAFFRNSHGVDNL
ncbi:O-antigen ligase family protein [Patescibacteria group bacterium]